MMMEQEVKSLAGEYGYTDIDCNVVSNSLGDSITIIATSPEGEPFYYYRQDVDSFSGKEDFLLEDIEYALTRKEEEIVG